MIATNRFFISIALGIALGAVGIVLIGYLAAVAMPTEFYQWFDQYSSLTIARVLTAFTMQLLGFGVLAALLGQTLGKTKHWLSNSLVSYLSMIGYVTILGAGESLSGISIESSMFAIVPLTSLLVSAYLSHKKYNNKLSSVLNMSTTLGNKG